MNINNKSLIFKDESVFDFSELDHNENFILDDEIACTVCTFNKLAIKSEPDYSENCISPLTISQEENDVAIIKTDIVDCLCMLTANKLNLD